MLDNKTMWCARPARGVYSVALATIAAYLLWYHLTRIVLFSYQMEYREGAMLVLTKALLQGINPFVSENHPTLSTQYGIVYNALVYPLARLLGPTFLAHRIVSGAALWASCLLLFLVLRRCYQDCLIAAAATLLWYAQLLYFLTPLARPDGVGLFFLMTAIFVPWRFGFSIWSLWLSAITMVLAFFTKAYFVLSLPILATYVFLFRSRRQGLGVVLMFLTTFIPVAVFLNTVFPAYFREVLLNISAGHHLDHFMVQARYYVLSFWALFLPLAWLLPRWWRERKTRLSPQEPDIFQYSAIWGVLAVVFMGGNRGAFLTYFIQLLTPFLLVCYCSIFRESLRDRAALCVPFLLITLAHNAYHITPRYSLTLLLSQWKEVTHLIASHENVLNDSAAVSGVLLALDRPVFSTGLSEYYTLGVDKKSVLKRLLKPTDSEVLAVDAEFSRRISDGIKARDWDMVVTGESSGSVAEKDYRVLSRRVIAMPHVRQKWPVTLWIPKEPRPNLRFRRVPDRP